MGWLVGMEVESWDETNLLVDRLTSIGRLLGRVEVDPLAISIPPVVSRWTGTTNAPPPA